MLLDQELRQDEAVGILYVLVQVHLGLLQYDDLVLAVLILEDDRRDQGALVFFLA